VTGAYQYCETKEGRFLCRSVNNHKWREYREPSGGAH
jgi:hypothetical protein